MNEKEIIQELVEKARAAQAIAAEYDQETVDRAVRAVTKIIYDHAEELANEAIAETKMGTFSAKLAKNKNGALFSWYSLQGKKSVGEIEYDPKTQIALWAKPAGVIACLTPSTNPTCTPTHNCSHALKGRNAIIVAPHPGAKGVTGHTVDLMRQALEEVGCPADLIQVIRQPSLPLSQELMAQCDVTVATGGPGMVKAAYSSGHPSFGVGQGNVQNFMGANYKDVAGFAKDSLNSRALDNGMLCTCDQMVHVPAAAADQVIEEYKKLGAYVVEDPEDVQKLREAIFPNGNTISRQVVGRSAAIVGQLAGLDVPETAPVIVVKVKPGNDSDVLRKEIMCPLLRVHVYENFKDAVEFGRSNYLLEGAGHSTAIYSDDPEEINYVAERIPVCRVAIKQVASSGAGRPFQNFMPHTLSLGCGFWGGNSISENLTYKHLMNYSRVHRAVPGMPHPTDEEIWAVGK